MTAKLALPGARHGRSLTGAEKVGVLLLALGQEKASELLKKFDPEELNIIMRSTDVMPTTSAGELESIIAEFEGRLDTGVPFVGKPDDIKLLISQVITDNRSAADSSRGGQPSQGFWPRFSELENDVIVPYLMKQHPQVATFILFRLGSERSATLLKLVDTTRRNELVGRLLGIKDVSPFVVEAMEATIQGELFENDEGASAQRTAMASILSNFEYSQTNELLDHIAGFRPKDAAAIKKMIFKFTDLDKLPPKALTSIMDGVPVERIVISLTGMQDVFISTVLATLSPRARRMAEAELRNGVNPAPADLASSRRAIVEAVLKLVADGTLDLSSIVTPAPPPTA
ncbi:MAG TPA: FliG C-terminal domain-containing protein [Hyphomicrobium sp.]|nr:FliG C-terminal domain-containing protein [Hyphomicrobium sp.]